MWCSSLHTILHAEQVVTNTYVPVSCHQKLVSIAGPIKAVNPERVAAKRAARRKDFAKLARKGQLHTFLPLS